MRFVFLFFGFFGFSAVFVAGYTADRSMDLVLRDAAVGCVVCAAIGRWFWQVVQSAVAQTAAQRRAALESAAAAEAAKTESTAPLRPATPASSSSSATVPAGSGRAVAPASAR